MKHYLILSGIALACWACGGNNTHSSHTREWLPEPDIAERLRYQKNQLDSLSSDEETHSEIWIKYNNGKPVRDEDAQNPSAEADVNYLLVWDDSNRLVYAAELRRNNTLMFTHYFDADGKTFAVEQHRLLEKPCQGKNVFETDTRYYDTDLRLIDQSHSLVTDHGIPLSPHDCNFPKGEIPAVSPDRNTYLAQCGIQPE